MRRWANWKLPGRGGHTKTRQPGIEWDRQYYRRQSALTRRRSRQSQSFAMRGVMDAFYRLVEEVRINGFDCLLLRQRPAWKPNDNLKLRRPFA